MTSESVCGLALQAWKRLNVEEKQSWVSLKSTALEGFAGFIHAFFEAEDAKNKHIPTWATVIQPLQIANTKLCNFGGSPLPHAEVESVEMEFMSIVASCVLSDVFGMVLRLEAVYDFWSSELDCLEMKEEFTDVLLDPVSSIVGVYKALAIAPFEQGWLKGYVPVNAWTRPAREDLNHLQNIREDLLSRSVQRTVQSSILSIPVCHFHLSSFF
jgi:hypothetical protein